jgi:phosphoglycolate phosphatase-like HAD superfamily hydrolase
VGLATGNFRQAAWLKLQRYGLEGFFREGAFGEDAWERAQLVALAARRVAGPRQWRRVLVVGDTPLDVAAALASGFVPVGVATGRYGEAELRAAGAHITFPHLGDWQQALKALLS